MSDVWWNKRGYKTWGDVFRACRGRGNDLGYCAWVADQWEKRQLKVDALRGQEEKPNDE